MHMGDKWNEKNWNLTKEYLPFAYGSGYILPVSIVKSIVHSNNIVPLRKLQNEDVTVGLWVAPYDIDYIDMKRYNGRMNQVSCPPGSASKFHISLLAILKTTVLCTQILTKSCRPKRTS